MPTTTPTATTPQAAIPASVDEFTPGCASAGVGKSDDGHSDDADSGVGRDRLNHTEAKVLDPCCGSRMWWFDRQHSDAIYGDRRSETLTVTDHSHGNAAGTRTLRIEPDMLMDFRALPFDDGTFKLVAFDPPHMERAGPKSWLRAKYGVLSDDWREDLRKGFAECFRVLATDGVLVFKWNETQVRIAEVLALTPHRPLFGNTSGKKAGTHFMVFMKPADEGDYFIRQADLDRACLQRGRG